MSVKFFSVRSGEVVHAETEPMIAAYFNSSDLNPNGIVQDYGWRIHPQMKAQIAELEEDEEFIDSLAAKLEIPVENVATYHVLKYISDKEDREKRKAEKAKGNEYQEQYDRELAEALAADDLAAATGEADNTPSSATEKPTNRARSNKPKVATAAEIAAQKKLDDEKLAKMIAEDDNKSNS